ncbi:MAG TPA: DUF899 family protein [Phenylobacterium sp.]|nr:DUF899 family protein [Phenylobacterium sp.]
MVEKTMQRPDTVSFPGESPAYREARDRLLQAEIALRRQTEAVAAQRRDLPPGGVAPQDYVFHEGADGRPVKLSELFGDKSVLLLYSFMYGPAMERPCPSCSAILDGLDGQVPHVTRKVALAVAAQSPIERIRAFAGPRGWRNLRLVSAAGTTYQRDYKGEDAGGSQWPILNVFEKADGVIRHVWASELAFAPRDPGQDPRHVDFIWPLWGLLDVSPQGRGDFRPQLDYA